MPSFSEKATASTSSLEIDTNESTKETKKREIMMSRLHLTFIAILQLLRRGSFANAVTLGLSAFYHSMETYPIGGDAKARSGSKLLIPFYIGFYAERFNMFRDSILPLIIGYIEDRYHAEVTETIDDTHDTPKIGRIEHKTSEFITIKVDSDRFPKFYIYLVYFGNNDGYTQIDKFYGRNIFPATTLDMMIGLPDGEKVCINGPQFKRVPQCEKINWWTLLKKDIKEGTYHLLPLVHMQYSSVSGDLYRFITVQRGLRDLGFEPVRPKSLPIAPTLVGNDHCKNENCLICLGSFEDENVIVPCCGKTFCYDCLSSWLDRNDICPHCRQNPLISPIKK